jgi:hypothetical protein
VVDLDLETDAVAGNEEDDEMDVDSRSEPTGQEREGKGKVRLSKITGNHVRGEATGKSDWIAKALRDRLENYLGIWNEGASGKEGIGRLNKAIQGIEDELRDLKELDGQAEAASNDAGQGLDWFAELEEVSKQLASLSEAG